MEKSRCSRWSPTFSRDYSVGTYSLGRSAPAWQDAERQETCVMTESAREECTGNHAALNERLDLSNDERQDAPPLFAVGLQY